MTQTKLVVKPDCLFGKRSVPCVFWEAVLLLLLLLCMDTAEAAPLLCKTVKLDWTCLQPQAQRPRGRLSVAPSSGLHACVPTSLTMS